MKHRIYHSYNLRERLGAYALDMGVGHDELLAAYDWLIEHEIVFEEEDGKDGKHVAICPIRLEKKLDHALAARLFVRLYSDLPTRMMPAFGKNWETLVDRWLRVWEQIYNIVINKIPSHNLRVAWLRLGGAKIGKGSTIWRNSEVLGVENLRMGVDSVIAWHCQVDARAGLVIGDHVCIASHVLIIAGSHDLMAPEFWSVSAPIYIDDYAWIASRAIIAHGSHIGKGAVVTANTIVSKDVAPYKIIGGSGAKPMGERPHDLTYKVGGKGLFTFLH